MILKNGSALNVAIFSYFCTMEEEDFDIRDRQIRDTDKDIEKALRPAGV